MWYYIHTQITVCTLACSIWCIMMSTHVSRFTWSWKGKKVQIKTHTPHFNDFAGQTIYASIMQPVYIFQIPPVQITKTHFNPFTAGHKQLETRPEKIPPNKVMCLPSVWSTITLKHKDDKAETWRKIQPWIIQLHFLYISLKARKLAQHGHIS